MNQSSFAGLSLKDCFRLSGPLVTSSNSARQIKIILHFIELHMDSTPFNAHYSEILKHLSTSLTNRHDIFLYVISLLSHMTQY